MGSAHGRFASHYNIQVSRFNSRFACPGSEVVDALMQDWSHDNNWVCPLQSTIPRVLRHTKSCKARGTLIVPEWPSAIFWPLLCDKYKKFASFIEEVFVLPKIKDLIIEGSGQKEVYKRKPSFSGCPSFNILAMKLYFSSSIHMLYRLGQISKYVHRNKRCRHFRVEVGKHFYLHNSGMLIPKRPIANFYFSLLVVKITNKI